MVMVAKTKSAHQCMNRGDLPPMVSPVSGLVDVIVLLLLFFVLAGQRMDSEDIVRSLENTAQLTILTNYSAPVWLAFHHEYEKCGCKICRAKVRLEFLFNHEDTLTNMYRIIPLYKFIPVPKYR